MTQEEREAEEYLRREMAKMDEELAELAADFKVLGEDVVKVGKSFVELEKRVEELQESKRRSIEDASLELRVLRGSNEGAVGRGKKI